MLDAYKQNSAPSLGSSLRLGEDFANAFSTSSSGLQEVIIGFAAAAIVWKVTFTAAEGTLAKGITESIKSGISGTVSRVAALPKYMQWIPIPASLDPDGSGTTSLRSLATTFDQRMRDIETLGSRPIGGRTADYYRNYAERPDGTVDQHVELLRTVERESDTGRVTRENLRNMLRQIENSGRGTSADHQAIQALIKDSDANLASIMGDDTRKNDFLSHLTNILGVENPQVSYEELVRAYSNPTGGARTAGAGAGAGAATTSDPAATPTPATDSATPTPATDSPTATTATDSPTATTTTTTTTATPTAPAATPTPTATTPAAPPAPPATP
jgi:hypothetical protein